MEERAKAEDERTAAAIKRKEAVLAMVPIKADLKWEEVNGLTVIYIKKNFSKFEKFLHKMFRGPEMLRIPLDKYGTAVWALCDGKNTIKSICEAMWSRYKEEMEGADERIPKFIGMLRARGLIYFEHEKSSIIAEDAMKNKNC